LILLVFFEAVGQDPLIYNYESHPIFLNPSSTGNFEGKARINLLYRNQWASLFGADSYKTGGVSFDTNVDLDQRNKLGLGFYSTIDKAGEILVGNSAFKLALAITNNLKVRDSVYHSISFGISSGLTIHRVNTDLAFPEPNTEELVNRRFADLNFGAQWRFNKKQQIKTEVGFSFRHLTEPNISVFRNGFVALNRAAIVHAKIELPLTTKFWIQANLFTIWQGNRKFDMYGLGLNRYFSKNNFAHLSVLFKGIETFSNSIRSKLAYRAKIKIKSLTLGYAYSTSELGPSFQSSTNEFALAYTF